MLGRAELTADSSIFKLHVMCHSVHTIGEILSPSQLLIVGCHILVINTQQFPHFQALNISVCLEVFGCHAEDTVSEL